MLTGFEKETAPLTEAEKEMIPFFERGFLRHIGKSKSITEKDIARSTPFKLHGARFRKLINHMRLNQIPKGYAILSSSAGYWLSANETEIRKCADSLNERGSAILAVSDALKRSAQDIYKPENSYK